MRKLNLNILTVLIVVGLGITYAAMHVNFVVANGLEASHINQQLELADGMHPENADFQSRLIFPNLVKIIFKVIKKNSWVLFLAEAVVSIFSLFGFFLLSESIISDRKYSIMSIIALSVFTPYALQLTHRYGELFLIGFYCVLIFFILTKRFLLYVVFLIIASLQRPDVALASVFFKLIHTLFIEKEYRKTIFDFSLFIIPILVSFGVARYMGIDSESYRFAYTSFLSERPFRNLVALRSVFVMYLLVWFLSIFLFNSFDKRVKLILLSLIPYLGMVTFLGSYSESRLLLPIISILIIGIVKAIKDKKLLE